MEVVVVVSSWKFEKNCIWIEIFSKCFWINWNVFFITTGYPGHGGCGQGGCYGGGGYPGYGGYGYGKICFFEQTYS